MFRLSCPSGIILLAVVILFQAGCVGGGNNDTTGSSGSSSGNYYSSSSGSSNSSSSGSSSGSSGSSSSSSSGGSDSGSSGSTSGSSSGSSSSGSSSSGSSSSSSSSGSSSGSSTSSSSSSSGSSSGIGFDHTSGQLDKTVWNVPVSALNIHNETTTINSELDQAVLSNARPGGIVKGSLSSYLKTSSIDGFISTEFIPDETPHVIYNAENFIGDTSRKTFHLLRANDGSIYWNSIYYPMRLFFPNNLNIGTKWMKTIIDQPIIIGKVFAYGRLGRVAFKPTVRTIGGELLPGDDPNTDNNIYAIDVNGQVTADFSKYAISYSFSDGYIGCWLDVERICYYEILSNNISSPDLKYDGCVEVALKTIYNVITPMPSNCTTVCGYDKYCSEYILYWKSGIGWVYWSGRESSPQWGFNQIKSAADSVGTFSLSDYNSQYDQAIYSPIAYRAHSNYTEAWKVGYSRGYRDVSINHAYGGYYAERPDMNDELQTQLRGIGADDNSIIQGNPIALARKAYFESAFISGFNLGASYYEADYIAVQDNNDILADGAINRSDINLSYNCVPEQFRRDGMFLITGTDGMNLLNGASVTGYNYPNGYDGMGIVVDAYDHEIVENPTKLKYQQDASGIDMRGVYISLPVMSVITTCTVNGAIKSGGVIINTNS